MGCSCFGGRPHGSRRKPVQAVEEPSVHDGEKEKTPEREPAAQQPAAASSQAHGAAEAGDKPLGAVSPFAAVSSATAGTAAAPPGGAQPSTAAAAAAAASSKPASPNDSATSAAPMLATPPPPSGAGLAVDDARRTSSQLSSQTSVSERRDTVTELLPLTGGSGNSAGSGRRAARSQPTPRGGTLQGRSDLFARLPAVLRTRSGGPLEGVEIGPLLGKGSFGCVYKGRWKGAMVAIKVLEHALILQDDISRETLLSTSIAHPGVVITYRITTVRVNDEPARDQAAEAQAASKDSASGNGGDRPDVPHAPADAEARPIASVQQSAAEQSAAAMAAANAEAAGAAAQGPDGARAAAAAAEAPQDAAAAEQGGSDVAAAPVEDAPEKQEDVLETWMLLEYCDRGSLQRAIERGKLQSRAPGGGPDLMHVLMCLMDIASAMAYLHSVGVLHGDLKSANVLLKSTATDLRGYVCKLADFGLSRVLAENKTHVSTHTYGTISYMAPELLSLGKFAKAADVYSFAILMWELYSGEALYEGMTVGQVLYAVVYDAKRPPIPDGCPPEYAALMRDCWKGDPVDRPDFEGVLARLQPLHDELRSRRRTTSSLATASAPGVSRALAMGLLPRTRSSDLREQTAAAMQAQAPSPSPLRHSGLSRPSPPQPPHAAHAQVSLGVGTAVQQPQEQQQPPQQQQPRPGRPRAPVINPFAAAQQRMQASGATSPTSYTADPGNAQAGQEQQRAPSAATSAASGAGEDTLSPLAPGSALNARAARLAALHADSPSATMSFAKLGTRSEGGWSANSPTPVGPSAYAASLAKKVQLPELGRSGSPPQALPAASAPAAGAWVNPFAAAQASMGSRAGSFASAGRGSVTAVSGGNGNGGGRSNTSSTTAARSNVEAEAAAKAALRRIADPDAPERPVASPENAPLLRFPKKERQQAELRRCNST